MLAVGFGSCLGIASGFLGTSRGSAFASVLKGSKIPRVEERHFARVAQPLRIAAAHALAIRDEVERGVTARGDRR